MFQQGVSRRHRKPTWLPLSIFHERVVRMKQQPTLEKALEKGLKMEEEVSLAMLNLRSHSSVRIANLCNRLDLLLQVTLSASCIDYFYVIYLLKFLLMDTLESSSAFNVPTTHWSGVIGLLVTYFAAKRFSDCFFQLHIFILGAVSIVSHYTNGNYWYGNY